METNTKIQAMMAQARELEQQGKQQREQETKAGAQAAITERADKIYEDREGQVTRNEELSRLQEVKQADEHRVSIYKKELEGIAPQRKEAEGKIAAEDVSEDAKTIYGKILEELAKEEVRLTEVLEQARGEMGETDRATTDNKEFINSSGKEAAEVLGYESKERGQLLDYVQEMRKLNKEAAEASQEYTADKLADKILEIVVKSQEKRYGGNADEYTLDLRSSYDRIPQAFFENPVLADEIRQKLFEKDRKVVDDYHAEGGNYEEKRKAFDDMQKLSHGKVRVLYRDQKSNQDQEAYVWEGNSNKNAYIDKGVRLPKIPYELKVLNEEQAVIDQAIQNPDVSIDSVKDQLGIKYDEEVLGKIQEDALKDNEEFDKAKKLEQDIRQAGLEVSRAEVNVKEQERSLDGFKAVLAYMEWMLNTKQPKETEYNLKIEGEQMKGLKQQLANLEEQLRTEQRKTGIMAVGTKGRQEKLTTKINPLKEQIKKLEDEAKNFLEELNTELTKQNTKVREKFSGDLLRLHIGTRSNRSFDATRPTDESIRTFGGEIPQEEQVLRIARANLEKKQQELERLRTS